MLCQKPSSRSSAKPVSVLATKSWFYCDDCVTGARRHIPDDSVDLAIDDPPFGIGESQFSSLYNRKPSLAIDGYVEAPDDYYHFSLRWLSERYRTLRPHGSAYVVSGWSNSDLLRQAAHEVGFYLTREIVWSFQFGPYTRSKYLSSHYDILFLTKHESQYRFNTYCRFGPHDKDEKGRSMCYQDRRDVWEIAKEYHSGLKKNQNKLPDALVEKMLLYSSNFGDIVSDFFLGNFTSAVVAQRPGRNLIGFEANPHAFQHGLNRYHELAWTEERVLCEEAGRQFVRGLNGDTDVQPTLYLSLTPQGWRRAERLARERGGN